MSRPREGSRRAPGYLLDLSDDHQLTVTFGDVQAVEDPDVADEVVEGGDAYKDLAPG